MYQEQPLDFPGCSSIQFFNSPHSLINRPFPDIVRPHLVTSKIRFQDYSFKKKMILKKIHFQN